MQTVFGARVSRHIARTKLMIFDSFRKCLTTNSYQDGIVCSNFSARRIHTSEFQISPHHCILTYTSLFLHVSILLQACFAYECWYCPLNTLAVSRWLLGCHIVNSGREEELPAMLHSVIAMLRADWAIDIEEAPYRLGRGIRDKTRSWPWAGI